jgi:hypothetical protein
LLKIQKFPIPNKKFYQIADFIPISSGKGKTGPKKSLKPSEMMASSLVV